MWGFIDCTHYYMSFGSPKVVLFDANLAVGTDERVGLLVPPGAGKSTIIRLLAGAEHPRSGTVVRDERGWPLGYGGAFLGGMTGEENVHNIAQMIGVDPVEMSAYCLDFSDLGDDYFQPLERYTGVMRGKLAFAVSFAIPAQTYLADEKIAVGDEQFREKCLATLSERVTAAGLIMVASVPRLTQEVCDRHGVLDGGSIVMCNSHEEATAIFTQSAEKTAVDEFEDEIASFDLA